MSKVTRLEQLGNENSLYRVTGVFADSQICSITTLRGIDFDSLDGVHLYGTIGYSVHTMLPNTDRSKVLSAMEMLTGLSKGTIKIMCVQRGSPTYDMGVE